MGNKLSRDRGISNKCVGGCDAHYAKVYMMSVKGQVAS